MTSSTKRSRYCLPSILFISNVARLALCIYVIYTFSKMLPNPQQYIGMTETQLGGEICFIFYFTSSSLISSPLSFYRLVLFVCSQLSFWLHHIRFKGTSRLQSLSLGNHVDIRSCLGNHVLDIVRGKNFTQYRLG